MRQAEHRPVSDLEFAAIDFESAGARRGETDVPVQVGIAVMKGPGLEIDKVDFVRTYLHTEQPIAWAAQRVHGISKDDLADAPSLLSLWPEVKQALGSRLSVAHGAGTEKRFLRAFPFHQFGPWVDTVTVARAAYPDLDGHKLGALVGELQLGRELDELCPGLTWHDALYDAVASLVILRKVIIDHHLIDKSGRILVSPDASAYYKLRNSQARS